MTDSNDLVELANVIRQNRPLQWPSVVRAAYAALEAARALAEKATNEQLKTLSTGELEELYQAVREIRDALYLTQCLTGANITIRKVQGMR